MSKYHSQYLTAITAFCVVLCACEQGHHSPQSFSRYFAPMNLSCVKCREPVYCDLDTGIWYCTNCNRTWPDQLVLEMTLDDSWGNTGEPCPVCGDDMMYQESTDTTHCFGCDPESPWPRLREAEKGDE